MSDGFEKKAAECAMMAQQSARLAAKVAPVVLLSSLLQEAVNLNQQLSNQVAELVEALRNERKKSPNADGGTVPPEARQTAG